MESPVICGKTIGYVEGMWDEEISHIRTTSKEPKENELIENLRNYLFANHGHTNRLVTGLCEECFKHGDYDLGCVNYELDPLVIVIDAYYSVANGHGIL